VLDTLTQVKECEPERPSGTNQTVDRDLETICLKCLDKEPQRRYGSAEALAEDLKRWLSGEPIQARPTGRVERVRRWCRRNPIVASSCAAVLLVTALGFIGVLEQWQVALAHEQQANQQRDEARVLNDQLQRTLYAAHINLAQHAWEAGNIGRSRELLELHRPKTGETDLRGFEWRYLDRLCHAEILTLRGHTGGVHSVTYSPDGKHLASASQRMGGGGEVKVWNAQTGQVLLTIKGGGGIVVFSPDGKRLASGSSDKTVIVWDAHTGQELRVLKGHSRNVMSLAFSSDGKRLASGSPAAWGAPKGTYIPGEAKVWDAQDGKELLTLKGNNGSVSVAFSPDGKRLVTVPYDNSVKVWDAQTGQGVLSVKAPAFAHGTVTFSPDGKRLALASLDSFDAASSTVRIWNAQTGQELRVLKTRDQVTRVAFSPDGKRLVSAAAGGMVTGALSERTVRVWDTQTGQELLSLRGHTNQVTSAVFSPDGKRLASASNDGTVKVWDATTSPEARTFHETTGQIWGVVFSPDGKRLAGISDEKTVRVLDAQTGKELLSCKASTGPIYGVAFSPDGKHLASGSEGKTVIMWDAQTGQEVRTLQGHADKVYSAVFSPDGKRLASASGDRTVKVWDAQTGKDLLTCKGHTGPVTRVAFSPDGKRLASNSMDGTVKLWDAQTGQEFPYSLKGHGLAFSPDGKRLAGSVRLPPTFGPTGAGEVRVWDAQTGRVLLILKEHTGNVTSVIFSPDGKRLASSGPFDNTVKVWDAQTGHLLLSLEGGSSSVAFSPDGHRLASTPDGRVKLWDASPLPAKP
jgi:WD40 repeat protein